MSNNNHSSYGLIKVGVILKMALLTAFLIVLYFPQNDIEDYSDLFYTRSSSDAESGDENKPEIDVPGYENAYLIKVNETIVYLKDSDQVKKMFQDTIDKYDDKGNFQASILRNSSRELTALTVSVNQVCDNSSEKLDDCIVTAGLEKAIDVPSSEMQPEGELSFDSFELGVKDVHFNEPVEIVQAYVKSDNIMDIKDAASLITENQETQQIYKVQSGDTLSEISISTGVPLEDIIDMNDALENESSTIFVDQELLITVPKPELSVVWTEQTRVEEAYDLPIEYIYNDEWYTNQKVTHVQPSAGYHEAIASVTRINEDMVSNDTLYEEIKMQPVAKVVEIGTIVPPTYIKPLAGGRLTSGFGKRKAPKAGASTYHKGVDWATPVGTSVYASSGGVVAFAGWGRGYGNVVYINHPDGKQTRYGHLSRINVSVGQSVKQGEVIAASGNTGVSTGPHVHFEILVGGTQVNPFDYLY